METGKDCYIDPSSSLDISSTSSASWLGLLNHGSLRAQSLQAGSHLYYFLTFPLFPLFFCLFTQAHLLIDGLVEGQYITSRTGASSSDIV